MSDLWETIVFAQNAHKMVLTWHSCCGEIIEKKVNDLLQDTAEHTAKKKKKKSSAWCFIALHQLPHPEYF